MTTTKEAAEWAAYLIAARGDRSQREFAEFLGVGLRTYTSWERQERVPVQITQDGVRSKIKK